MSEFILNIFPDEISRQIYDYLNPIKKSPIRRHDGDIYNWCHFCGEKPKLLSFRILEKKDCIKCLKCFFYNR